MLYSLVRMLVLGSFLFSVVAAAFSPQLTKLAAISNTGHTGLKVVLNKHIGELETLGFLIRAPYLVEKGLSPFQIEAIMLPAAREADTSRDPMRYHILEVKIAQVEVALFNTLLSAREHLQKDNVQAYEYMRDNNEERLRIHQDIVTSIKRIEWKTPVNDPDARPYPTTDPYFKNRAERWGAFALTADNKELQETDLETLLATYRENIEQQELGFFSNGKSYEIEDNLAHVAVLLKSVHNNGSDLYIFDIIYELREHIDAQRVALLYALKSHLRRQQLDLMHKYISDYRPDLRRLQSDSKKQEDSGIAIYRFLSSKGEN